MVSWYHHAMLMNDICGFLGTFDQMADMFMKGQTVYGNYWTMLNSGWSRRYHTNLKFLWFEDMKRDLVPIIKDLCNFTGYKLTPEKIDELDRIVHIDNFRARQVESAAEDRKEVIRKFLRKGKTGDHKNHFSEELDAKFNEWIKENLEGTDINIPFPK